MESNIKGLVAAGHEMASELKAECGAVDMRSVAKLISDLATQLEVQLVRANALAEDHQKAIENLKQKLVECNRYNYCADAVKGVEDACHAAMLQGIQPVSQTYKFPVNTPCQDAPAHIWLQTAGVWPEDGELSELTWCSHNQHHDDTLYVRADLVNGNSPVTPDGWVMVPKELTPEMMRAVQIRSELGGYATSNLSGAYNMFSEFWNVAVSAAPKVDDL